MAVNLPVSKRYIGRRWQRRERRAQLPAFDQRVFVTSRHDTGGLLPSPYVGGWAGGMS